MCSARRVKRETLTGGTFTNIGRRKKMKADIRAESKANKVIAKVLRMIGIIAFQYQVKRLKVSSKIAISTKAFSSQITRHIEITTSADCSVA